jgi:hypothetical protein
MYTLYTQCLDDFYVYRKNAYLNEYRSSYFEMAHRTRSKYQEPIVNISRSSRRHVNINDYVEAREQVFCQQKS